MNSLWDVNLFSKKSFASLNTRYLISIKKYQKNLNFKKFMVKLQCVWNNTFLLSFKSKKKLLQMSKILRNQMKSSLKTLSKLLSQFSLPHHMTVTEINFFTVIFDLFFPKVNINAVIFLIFGWCLIAWIARLLKSYTKTQVTLEFKN